MQEQSHYAVGIDIGTKIVRCVIGHVDQATGAIKIVGVGEAPNSGMRKGVVSHLNGPATAIDAALDAAERMSGHRVTTAVMSANGPHIMSTKADGMIAVTAADGGVTVDDVMRLEEVATTGKVPVNRDVLEVVPYEYRLDGQDGIKDPVGMTGTRLELRANVVSGLAPHLANIHRLAEMTNVAAVRIVPSVLAGAHAVLQESQLENGVAVIDIGAATTGVAVFEEGDLQHLAVIPIGSQHVTNDLAIGLKVDLEVAEKVKLADVSLGAADGDDIELEHDGRTLSFARTEVAEIIEARYEELFERVAKELKRAGGISKMPSGAVLIGGGAQIGGIAEFAKQQLGVAAAVGAAEVPGVSDTTGTPSYAVAVGLMKIAGVSHGPIDHSQRTGPKVGNAADRAGGFLRSLFARFK
ncbi:MAG: cell division protein FtsA [Candidatus Saccharibacteria bacterium]|nr:cell division protein FtsA [Candidatus Saccharibacteria bacterium]